MDRAGRYEYNSRGTSQKVVNFGLGPIIWWRHASGAPIQAAAENQISVPSEMLAVMDALMKPSTGSGNDAGQCGPMLASALKAEPYVLPHGKNYNSLFCDGHVNGMSPESLFNPMNTASLWNYDHQPHPESWDS